MPRIGEVKRITLLEVENVVLKEEGLNKITETRTYREYPKN